MQSYKFSLFAKSTNGSKAVELSTNFRKKSGLSLSNRQSETYLDASKKLNALHRILVKKLVILVKQVVERCVNAKLI